MENKVALITGGAKGIGRSIAIALAKENWEIVICYRNSKNEADKLASEIKIKTVQCDVSNPSSAQELVLNTEKEFGKVDALINCAGPYHRVNLFDETPEGWNEMFDNNLHPIFYLAKWVTPVMKERKFGRIINFSMANADQLIAQPEVTAHYIAKVGVLVLTRTLAKMLAPYNVTVNSISPGFINSGSAPKEELDKMAKRIPAGFIGSTEDAVNVVLFLLSDSAKYINGANIHLSGAWGI